MRVVIEHLTKHFGDTAVLQDVSLEVRDQELFFLLGPSGCGKTTLLRLVAGFYQPDQGQIRFGDRVINQVPPHQRNTGMVFQNYALWPHLTVAQNIAYGLDVRGLGTAEKQARVAEVLGIVQMIDYAGRLPNQLSGGQQQRVALARALVVRPDVLLLDEPLSNLDAKLRLEMREEIRRIHAQTRITTIYVTHDQKESLSLADRMSVLRAGRIEQTGEPRAIYGAPANRFVADFVGETNWLTASVAAGAGGLWLETAVGKFVLDGRAGLVPGQAAWVGFRPEAVQFGSGLVNHFSATIAQVSYLGEVEEYQLQVAGGALIKAVEQNPIHLRQRGQTVAVQIDPRNLFVFPRAEAASPPTAQGQCMNQKK